MPASTSLPDQLFDRLVAAILDGRYVPGDRLPSQRALAAEFGVNMASLRAAVDRVARLGLVEVRHGEPMRVADWRKSGGLEIVVHAAASDSKLRESVFEARSLLLREAAHYAAERASDHQRDEIVRLAAMFSAMETDEQRQLIDFAFMAEIIDAADNLVFTFIVNSMRQGYLARSEDFRGMLSAPDSLGPLYEIVAGHVRAGRPAQAADAMRDLTDAQAKALNV